MTGWSERDLLDTWKALMKAPATGDMVFAPLARFGNLLVESGRQFPSGMEAFSVTFTGATKLKSKDLPRGRGFSVSLIETNLKSTNNQAVALIRSTEGELEIFSIIAVDILRTLEAAYNVSKCSITSVFIDRVNQWQNFMSKPRKPLSRKAQLGLLGELWMLRHLVKISDCATALACWMGPRYAAQDFHINSGSVEVKSSIGKGSFRARINSLDQLDTDRQPTFLCALRFDQSSGGITLVDIIQELRALFNTSGVQRNFDALLMLSGYFEEHTSQYDTPFRLESLLAYQMDSEFPRLIRSTVPIAVRSAKYVLDIDAIDRPHIDINEMMKRIGVS